MFVYRRRVWGVGGGVGGDVCSMRAHVGGEHFWLVEESVRAGVLGAGVGASARPFAITLRCVYVWEEMCEKEDWAK